MPDELAFPQPGPDWSKPIINGSNANPGDIVFYDSGGAHVEMYADPGRTIGHSSTVLRTSLPVAPVDGQIVMFQPPSGPMQQLRYNASAARWDNLRIDDLLDTDRAEAQAAKIPELLQVKPPVELLERLDPDYVGEIELVQIVGAEEIDYAIEFTTPRGKMRVHRTPRMTWEETLIRKGLLDGP